MPSDGASDSATGGQPRPLCPRTATATLHTTGDVGAADHASESSNLANCDNCCTQNFAK
jgi:hypothetical protein